MTSKLKDLPDDIRESVEHGAVYTLLDIMNQDISREGLKETPKRYVKFLKEFCNPPEFNFTTFENEGDEAVDQMIVKTNIPFYSLCEHHLAPFFGHATIAYIPNKKIVGLSKLSRVLDKFARRPQNQERITHDVAKFINEKLNPKGVGVVLTARHLCVEMRGVQKANAYTTTSAVLGVFKESASTRQEFMNLIKNQ
jgi:GTP cyclohydrolase IA